MLALAASYGVYHFAALFVPTWVAVVQAAAFEVTYIGLALLDVLDKAQRRRAVSISVGAVLVSVIYNSLAGFFHRNPQVLQQLSLWQEGVLAVLHGAPLAIVAYLVADLLLHSRPATGAASATPPPSRPAVQVARPTPPVQVAPPPAAPPRALPATVAQPVQPAQLDETTTMVVIQYNQLRNFGSVGQLHNRSREWARKLYKQAKEVAPEWVAQIESEATHGTT
jgi:hypothetical protein